MQLIDIFANWENAGSEWNKWIFYKDINENGNKNFITILYNVGNTLASIKKDIFEVKVDGFSKLDTTIDETPYYSLIDIKDLNQDGVSELIIADDSWEINLCTSHVAAPIKYMIYSWEDGAYRDSTTDFPKYFEDKAKNYEFKNQDTIGECEGECFGSALSEYFRYMQMGREQEGWQRFLQLSDGVKNNLGFPQKTCRDYVIKLHEKGKPLKPPKAQQINYYKYKP